MCSRIRRRPGPVGWRPYFLSPADRVGLQSLPRALTHPSAIMEEGAQIRSGYGGGPPRTADVQYPHRGHSPAVAHLILDDCHGQGRDPTVILIA